jgi:hypothetical protein
MQDAIKGSVQKFIYFGFDLITSIYIGSENAG